MPRGQAIPDAPAALFDAADRILARQGPEGITSRALTDEAGVAKGVLHNHFHDLDGFLASYAADRITAAVSRAESLRAAPASATSPTTSQTPPPTCSAPAP